MGSCCQHFFHKEEIHTNDSRLKLLENKVSLSFHTENDQHFTYYLHLFDQHQYLQRILKDYKMANEQTEDTSQFVVRQDQIAYQHHQIQEYIEAFANQASPLRLKMKEDQTKILSELKQYPPSLGESSQPCMLKLQIQNIKVVRGIIKIRIVKQFTTNSEKSQKQQILIINRAKSQSIYRQFVFPSASKSRVRLLTEPLMSGVTIDLEDVAKPQVICDIFTFKARAEQFGFIALRMQYFTMNEQYRKEKRQRLGILQKQLRLCEQGKDGLQRLSQYHSETNSLRNTFISEPMSDYPNQYEA